MQQHETLASRTISTCTIVSKGGHTSSESLSISFSVYHVKDPLLSSFTRRVSSTRIIACAYAIFSNEEVFRIVDILVWSTLHTVDNLEPSIQSV